MSLLTLEDGTVRSVVSVNPFLLYDDTLDAVYRGLNKVFMTHGELPSIEVVVQADMYMLPSTLSDVLDRIDLILRRYAVSVDEYWHKIACHDTYFTYTFKFTKK